MGLESGTFISALVSSNPLGSDFKTQGDDHIRLIKSVLQATLPNANRAFRFEEVITKTTTYAVAVTDQRKLVLADASAGAFTITLPLGSNVFDGFSVIVEKIDSGVNVVTVDGNGAETINGSASRSLSAQYQAEKYMWDGSEWKVIAVTRPGTGDLQDGSVTTAKIADLAVTGAKIAAGTITEDKFDADRVRVAGDTMTGDLAISKTDAAVTFTDGGNSAQILYTDSGDQLNIVAPNVSGKKQIHFDAAGNADLEKLTARFGGANWGLYTRFDIASQALAEAGTDNDKLITSLRAKQSIDANTVIKKEFTSSEQTITAGGSLTLAHGLSSAPKLVQCRIVCTSAEHGYSVGDELLIPFGDTINANAGVSVVPDATNLNIRFGNKSGTFFIVNKSNGASALITNSNWNFKVSAWA